MTKEELRQENRRFSSPRYRRFGGGPFIAWQDTKMGGPYGVLDEEDLQNVKGEQKGNQQ